MTDSADWRTAMLEKEAEIASLTAELGSLREDGNLARELAQENFRRAKLAESERDKLRAESDNLAVIMGKLRAALEPFAGLIVPSNTDPDEIRYFGLPASYFFTARAALTNEQELRQIDSIEYAYAEGVRRARAARDLERIERYKQGLTNAVARLANSHRPDWIAYNERQIAKYQKLLSALT